MSFRTDAGGFALKLNDVKLMAAESSWATRMSQIGKCPGGIIICTYSLPDVEYIMKILDKHPDNVVLVLHEKFRRSADLLKARYRGLHVYLRPDVHAKLVLIEPETVWLSSANFGRSGWFEQTIGIHDRRAFEFYFDQIESYLFEERKSSVRKSD